MQKEILVLNRKIELRSLAFFCSSVLLICLHNIALGLWLVDDAAISQAYARNLYFYGALTAQIGDSPVEGFSNPLLVIILTAFQWIENPTLLSKSVAIFFLLLTAWRLSFFSCLNEYLRDAIRWSSIFLLSQPGVVIWSLSGLENSILLFFATSLLIDTVGHFESKEARPSLLLRIGIAAAALSLTRPEGLIYSMYFPLVFLHLRGLKNFNRRIVLFAIAPAFVVSIAYLLFRISYFNELFPNTYFAKGGPTANSISNALLLEEGVIIKLLELSDSISGALFKTWTLVAFAIMAASALFTRKPSILIAPLLLATMGTFIYLIYPYDWMPEFRFATIAYVGIYTSLLYFLISKVTRNSYVPLLVIFLSHFYMGQQRIAAFAESPTISVEEVTENSERFYRWSTMLNVERPSILTADVGGLLMSGRLKVFDLGMLTDKTIAVSLGEGSRRRSHEGFLDYVFMEARPTIIATRAYHSWLADLHSDPRFSEQYIPIFEYQDHWILQRYGVERYSGDYVRKEFADQNRGNFILVQSDAQELVYPGCARCGVR